MKRILVFSTQHMPTGGIESHLREFCQHMAETDVTIDLLVTNCAMRPDTELFYQRVCRQLYLGSKGRSSVRLLWLLSVASTLRHTPYDALYTNGQGESLYWLSKFITRRQRWVHHHHTAGDAADQAHWGTRYWQTLRTADRVVACSYTNAAQMSLTLGRPVDAIPCFSRAVTPTHVPNPTGRVRLGYYGRLIPEKGIDLLCRLSNDPDLREAEFHLWGEGEAYPASFFATYPNIVYHGAFSGPAELARVLGTLDALLLLTTHGEGLPISLLEAMSAGLPWLATERGGIPDIALDPMATRLLPFAADYEQTKQAIRQLIDDLKAGHIARQTQLDHYQQTFAADVLTAQWQDVLGLVEQPDYSLSL